MKKLLFTAALLFGAFAASAQVSVVKEAKSKKSNPVEAAKIIEPALTNPETANDPNTWQLAGDFQKAIYDAENDLNYMIQAGIEKNKTANMPLLYNSLLKMFEYYMKCDEVEQAKIASGELKKAKLRKKNVDALLQVRPNLANGGIEAFNNNDYPTAQKFFATYVDMATNPMFADKAEVLKADTLTALFANYAAMAAASKEPKDIAAIIKYGTIGKEDKTDGWRGLSLMADVYGNKETGDSIKWLEVIKEGTQKFPNNDYFIGNMIQYYLQKGKVDVALTEIDQLLATNEKPYFLYVKGLLLFEKKDYAGVQEIMDKVIEKNETDEQGNSLVAEAYAKKGDCYFESAQKLIEESSALSMDDPKYSANEAKIKEAYELAKPFYESAQKIEPNNKEIWGRPLLVIYYALNAPEYEILAKELEY